MIEKNVNTRKTNEDFIKESITIHSDRFDYSLVDYKSNKTNIKIICKIHGVFEQTPKSHLKGSGCIKCNSRGSKYKNFGWAQDRSVQNKSTINLFNTLIFSLLEI